MGENNLGKKVPNVSVYQEGHIKHNPETKEVALRTIFPEDQGVNLANMAWLIATTNSGARTSPTSGVEDWPDLHTPQSSGGAA